MALLTLQALGTLAVLELRLASRANQHFEKIFGQHGFGIIKATKATGQGAENRAGDKKYGILPKHEALPLAPSLGPL